jgi:hypothetical protein
LDDENLDDAPEVQLLNPAKRISKCWDEEPPKKCVHFIVRVPPALGIADPTAGECFIHLLTSSACLTVTLPEDKRVLNSDYLEEYEGIFIKVKTRGGFESSDIELNDVKRTRSVPGFVAEFERTLDSQPGLARNVRSFLDSSVCFSIRTAQCRCLSRPTWNVYTIPDLGLHILGLVIPRPPRTDHPRI